MKAPSIIYAVFEALVKKMHRCERPEGLNVSYREQTDQHEACGFSYLAVRSDVSFGNCKGGRKDKRKLGHPASNCDVR